MMTRLTHRPAWPDTAAPLILPDPMGPRAILTMAADDDTADMLPTVREIVTAARSAMADGGPVPWDLLAHLDPSSAAWEYALAAITDVRCDPSHYRGGRVTGTPGYDTPAGLAGDLDTMAADDDTAWGTWHGTVPPVPGADPTPAPIRPMLRAVRDRLDDTGAAVPVAARVAGLAVMSGDVTTAAGRPILARVGAAVGATGAPGTVRAAGAAAMQALTTLALGIIGAMIRDDDTADPPAVAMIDRAAARRRRRNDPNRVALRTYDDPAPVTPAAPLWDVETMGSDGFGPVTVRDGAPVPVTPRATVRPAAAALAVRAMVRAGLITPDTPATPATRPATAATRAATAVTRPARPSDLIRAAMGR